MRMTNFMAFSLHIAEIEHIYTHSALFDPINYRNIHNIRTVL